MDVRRSGSGAPKGFAVPVVAGLALWLVVTRLAPVLWVETGLDVAYTLVAVWSFAQPLALAAALVLGLVGVFRLLRALELHLRAGRPAPTARVDVERPADR